MKSISVSRRSFPWRDETGQALVEGTVMLVVLSAFFVAIVFCLINTTVVSGYDYKLRIVAQEAAKFMTRQRYFLGMERCQPTDFTPEPNFMHAQEEALDLSNEMLRAVHLPECSAENFHVEAIPFDLEVKGPRQGTRLRPVAMYRVTMRIEHLPLVGNMFPFVDLSAEGLAMENTAPPHAAGRIHFHDPSPGGRHRAVTFPAYFATRSTKQPDGTIQPGANRSVYLKRGIFTGGYPVAYIPLKMDTSGVPPSISLVEPDDTYSPNEHERGQWDW